MPLNLLSLSERERKHQSQEHRPPGARPPSLFQFRRGWYPIRGLVYSVLLHEVLFAASVVVPWDYWLPAEMPAASYEVTLIQKNEPLILPDLKPFQAPAPAPSGGAPAGNPGAGSGKLSAPAGRLFKGVVHRGPQVIVSNPEPADNFVQTIRQPELIRPPKLAFPLPLPNIVAIKAALPVPAAPSVAGLQATQARAVLHELATAADALAVPPPVEVTVNHPRIELPTAAPVPPLPVRQTPAEHASTTLPTPPSLPSGAGGNADRDLLVLNAMLTSVSGPVAVPPGELHGAFAVSPTPPPAPSSGPTGMALGGGKDGAATGTGGNGSAGNAASGAGAGKAGTGNGSAGSGRGSAGSGSGTGAGTKGAGKGSGGSGGHGSAKGTGPGSGAGTTTTLAGGGGTGGPFPDISIAGGMGAPIPASGGTNVRTPGTYALMIVGGGASGGGLKDYGVFHHETVYTIYVDLAGSGGATWTLQYAVVQVPGSATAAQGVVTPPYPVEKHAPEYPADLASQYEGRLIVVTGVIDNEGKVQKLRLIQGPHPKLAQSLMDSLQKCKFGAAQIGDTAVPVKFLLGAPVTAGK